MKKNNYIKSAKKSSKIKINELKKIKKVFKKSFVRAAILMQCE